jgi:rare lipoprotein A
MLTLATASLAACAGGPRPQTANTSGAPTSRYTGYSVGKPYQINGIWYYPKAQPNYDEIGIASWYGEQFHNHYTADGEVFDMHLPSAAHKTLPLPSLVEVTNLANGRTLVVRVNDRGPFVPGRVIDLSREAAAELGFVAAGVTRVRVRYVGQADPPPGTRQYQASNRAQPPAPKANGGPIQMASVASAPAPVAATTVSAATVAAVATVSALDRAPLPKADPPSAPQPQALADVDSLLADTPPAAAPDVAVSAPAPVGLQLQAGIFASRARAQALAARLGGAGTPDVEPFERGGQMFYRVTVRGFASADQAAAARNQAVALGAPDARIVGGS